MYEIQKSKPHDVLVEKNLIGSILTDEVSRLKGIEHLGSEDFYEPRNRCIYDAVLELNKDNLAIDLVTVSSALNNKITSDGKSQLAFVDDKYLKLLFDGSYQHDNVDSYITLLSNKTAERKLLELGTDIEVVVRDTELSVDDKIGKIEKKLSNVQKQEKGLFSNITDVTEEVLNKIKERSETDETIFGLKMPFNVINEMTGGIQDGDYVVLAGRPSSGKTGLAMNIARYVGIESNKTVLIFSLEMSANQLVTRLLSTETGISSLSMRTNRLTEEQWDNLVLAKNNFENSEIYIDDNTNNMLELKTKVKRFATRKKIDLIIIDYLQLLSSPDNRFNSNRNSDITDISREIKLLCTELKVPVIALSQLSREVEKRADKRPILSDLRDSGSIEQDVDMVWFLYRDSYYNKKTVYIEGISSENEIAELIFAKHRNGPTGTLLLNYSPSTITFSDYTDEDE